MILETVEALKRSNHELRGYRDTTRICTRHACRFLKRIPREDCGRDRGAASTAAAARLREINVTLQPLFAGLTNEAQEICAFGLGTAAADQNDQPEMRSSRGELQKVVAIASDHHALVGSVRPRKRLHPERCAGEDQ